MSLSITINDRVLPSFGYSIPKLRRCKVGDSVKINDVWYTVYSKGGNYVILRDANDLHYWVNTYQSKYNS